MFNNIVLLNEALQRLEEGDNNFCIEVEVVNIENRYVTRKRNILVRTVIKDESRSAVLVVWGSDKNTHNIEIIERKPRKIRICKPLRPRDWARKDYNVDLWAHEKITHIEIIE